MSSEKNKTVVVGFTGRVDSVVAAYLLKKQGYSCIGVYIQPVDPQKMARYERVFGECQNKLVTQAQKVCQELEIPFYAVNAQELYASNVIDLVIARRLSGEAFSPCVACNKMKLEILWEKAKKLGADSVATGHYARIGQNQKTGERYLISSGQPDEDETILLSGLEARYLENLLLPLGDMRKTEVIKIAESLNMGLGSTTKNLKHCFNDYSAMAKYIDAHVAKSLRQEGEIINAEDGSILGNHNGIYHYRLGQDKVVGKAENAPIDPHLKVITLSALQKRVYMANITGLEFDYCSLNRFMSTYEVDTSKPFQAYVQFYGFKDRLPCFVTYKTNETILLEFSNRHYAFLASGLSVAVYSKSGAGAKFIGAGLLGQFGVYQKLDRTTSPEDKNDDKKDKLKKQKDISLF